MNNNDLKYHFFYWGPYLFKTFFDLKQCKELLNKGKKLKKEANAKLAGVIKKELEFTKDDQLWFAKKANNHFLAYLESANNWYGRKIAHKLNLENWEFRVYDELIKLNCDFDSYNQISPTDEDFYKAIYNIGLQNEDQYNKWFEFCEKNNLDMPASFEEELSKNNTNQLTLFKGEKYAK